MHLLPLTHCSSQNAARRSAPLARCPARAAPRKEQVGGSLENQKLAGPEADKAAKPFLCCPTTSAAARGPSEAMYPTCRQEKRGRGAPRAEAADRRRRG